MLDGQLRWRNLGLLKELLNLLRAWIRGSRTNRIQGLPARVVTLLRARKALMRALRIEHPEPQLFSNNVPYHV
jgi:hypothetical protein